MRKLTTNRGSSRASHRSFGWMPATLTTPTTRSGVSRWASLGIRSRLKLYSTPPRTRWRISPTSIWPSCRTGKKTSATISSSCRSGLRWVDFFLEKKKSFCRVKKKFRIRPTMNGEQNQWAKEEKKICIHGDPFDDRRSSFMNEKNIMREGCCNIITQKNVYIEKIMMINGDWLIYGSNPESRSNFTKKKLPSLSFSTNLLCSQAMLIALGWLHSSSLSCVYLSSVQF